MRSTKRMVVTITVVLAMVLGTCAVSFAKTYYSCVIHIKDSSPTVIVGDSRITGLYKSGYTNANVISSSGGRYSTGKDHYRKINSTVYGPDQKQKVAASKSRQANIEKAIRNSLKKHGKCRLILLGTANEVYSGTNPTTGSVKDRAEALSRYAKSMRLTESYRGKKVTAKVYVVEAPKGNGGSLGKHFKSSYFTTYNNQLKSLASRYSYTYVNMRTPTGSEYKSDGLHFDHGKKGYNKYMWDRFSDLKY